MSFWNKLVLNLRLSRVGARIMVENSFLGSGGIPATGRTPARPRRFEYLCHLVLFAVMAH